MLAEAAEVAGCSVLLPDQVQAVPYWIDDESLRESIIASSNVASEDSTKSSLSKRRMTKKSMMEYPKAALTQTRTT